jgi:hypothetical protein
VLGENVRLIINCMCLCDVQRSCQMQLKYVKATERDVKVKFSLTAYQQLPSFAECIVLSGLPIDARVPVIVSASRVVLHRRSSTPYVHSKLASLCSISM